MTRTFTYPKCVLLVGTIEKRNSDSQSDIQLVSPACRKQLARLIDEVIFLLQKFHGLKEEGNSAPSHLMVLLEV